MIRARSRIGRDATAACATDAKASADDERSSSLAAVVRTAPRSTKQRRSKMPMVMDLGAQDRREERESVAISDVTSFSPAKVPGWFQQDARGARPGGGAAEPAGSMPLNDSSVASSGLTTEPR